MLWSSASISIFAKKCSGFVCSWSTQINFPVSELWKIIVDKFMKIMTESPEKFQNWSGKGPEFDLYRSVSDRNWKCHSWERWFSPLETSHLNLVATFQMICSSVLDIRIAKVVCRPAGSLNISLHKPGHKNWTYVQLGFQSHIFFFFLNWIPSAQRFKGHTWSIFFRILPEFWLITQFSSNILWKRLLASAQR